MNEREIIKQCFRESSLLELHKNFTDLDSIKDNQLNRIFKAILETLIEGEIPDIEKLFQALKKNDRVKDIGLCMELITEIDREKCNATPNHLPGKKIPRMEFIEIQELFGELTLDVAFKMREKLFNQEGR